MVPLDHRDRLKLKLKVFDRGAKFVINQRAVFQLLIDDDVFWIDIVVKNPLLMEILNLVTDQNLNLKKFFWLKAFFRNQDFQSFTLDEISDHDKPAVVEHHLRIDLSMKGTGGN